MRARLLTIGGILLGAVASVCGQVTGTLETYLQSDSQKRGIQDILSWGELQGRLNENIIGTISYSIGPNFNELDEADVELDYGNDILRLGRIRTAFGFSTWADVYYNGFNHQPLIRTSKLVDNLGLARQDCGAEWTFGSPSLQVQTGLLDSSATTYQFVPRHFDATSVRVQSGVGTAIVGIDYLWRFNSGDQIAGVDARWSIPHLLLMGEYMTGIGGDDVAGGFYVDATYRIPGLERTQAVGRYERLHTEAGDFGLQTIGLRQVIGANLTVNVNYGWGSGLAHGAEGGEYGSPLDAPGLLGWSARMMVQVHF